ncbi:hypothetical protein [Agrobacterium rosae]|uniref:hypothetical protein n=1 Tax=Agrobacterium rosae TaxID=1972867 RepID=UPI00203417E6|nr:hypothetical protein [Agrobacterium rosae]MCM2436337.1 hypothetical protein [Agrobacterium rosae]
MPDNVFLEYDSFDKMDASEVDIARELVSGLYGRPHSDVKFDGVYFYERRFPSTFYPDVNEPMRIGVWLPKHQADNPLACFYHLTHELVHCLTPNGPKTGQATMLEEGLAEHSKIYLVEQFFQQDYQDTNFRTLGSRKYVDAFEMVEELIADHGLNEMRDIVKTMRSETNRPFAAISLDDLKHYFTASNTQLLRKLSAPFHDGWPQ